MRLMTIDSRALRPIRIRIPCDAHLRRTPGTLQTDALLLARIKAVGIVQPPIISPQQDDGNSYGTVKLTGVGAGC
jgi:ParB family transcriptional regulator, chromosome partitioning protein